MTAALHKTHSPSYQLNVESRSPLLHSQSSVTSLSTTYSVSYEGLLREYQILCTYMECRRFLASISACNLIAVRVLIACDGLCSGEGGEGLMGAAIDTLMPAVIDGLAACGVESPFTRMYRKQDACTKRVPQVAMPAVGESLGLITSCTQCRAVLQRHLGGGQGISFP